jgi:hypothetical protein
MKERDSIFNKKELPIHLEGPPLVDCGSPSANHRKAMIFPAAIVTIDRYHREYIIQRPPVDRSVVANDDPIIGVQAADPPGVGAGA